jgi:hypothetical protein
MRRWQFTSDDVTIMANAGEMALDLHFLSAPAPSVEIVNTARRYLYSHLEIMHPFIPDLSLGPLLYTQNPPGEVFRAFDLLSAQDDITIFLWGSLANCAEELPLLPPYSRYTISLVGPSIREFSEHAGDDGWITSWAMTLFDVWMFTVIDVATGVKVGGHSVLKTKVTENLAWMLLSTFKGAVAAFYVGANSYAQFLQAMVTGLPPIIEKIMKDPKVVDSFVLELSGLVTRTQAEAAFKNLGPVAFVSRMLGLVNLIVAFLDLLRLKAKGTFAIDIPLRRRPDLRTSITKLQVAVGARVAWPLTLYLPDGRQFSFTDETFECVATRTSTSPDDQEYQFEDITVYTGGQSEILPVTLTLQAMDLGGSSPLLGVRPPAVAALPDVGGYSFYKGLGKFIQGLAEGPASVVARIDLKDGSFPLARESERYIQVRTMVEVAPPTVAMKWRYQSLRIETGRWVPLELRTTLPFNLVFDTMEPFTALVAFAPDYSWLRLTNISSGRNMLTMPFELTFAVLHHTRGRPIVDFKPVPSMEIAAAVGRIAFPFGLSSAVRPLRAGEVTISASMALDPSSMEGVSPPPEATLPLGVTLGRPTLRAEQNTVVLDDNIVGGFGLTVTFPDGTSFSTNKNAIQAQVDIASTKMEVTSIGYDPTAIDPPTSPLDLTYELCSSSVVAFSPDVFIGPGVFSTPFYGTMCDFLSAKSAGTDTITVSGFLNAIDEVELENPLAQSVVVQVAPPAIVVLDWYEENLGERKPIQPQLEIWHANTLKLFGHVDNHSPQTKVRLFLRRPEEPWLLQPGSDLSVQSDGIFEGTVRLLQPGNNDVRVEAEKATNVLAGGPSIQSLAIRALTPELSLDSVASETGKRTLDFRVFGKRALQVDLWADIAGGTRLDIPSVVERDGSFDMSRMVNLEEGVNTLHASATNGVASLEITAQVAGKRPELSIVSVEDTPVMNGKVDIYTTPATIFVGMNYCDEAKLDVRGPGSTAAWTDMGVVTSHSPKQVIDFPNEGVYTLRIRASNDFGETAVEVTVTQVVSSFTYNFKLKWSVVDEVNGPHYRIKIKSYDPVVGNSETQIVTEYETGWYSRPAPDYPDTSKVLPNFEFETYEWMWDAINGGTKLVGTNNAKGSIMIWGSLVQQRGKYTFNYQMIVALKKAFVRSIVDPALGSWPDDGCVRFKNAQVVFGWSQTGSDACYSEGALLP